MMGFWGAETTSGQEQCKQKSQEAEEWFWSSNRGDPKDR